MTLSSSETLIRATLPFIRFMQVFIPLPVSAWLANAYTASVPLPPGITRTTVHAGGVPCVWLIPDGSPKDRVLLYLHGGGFVFGLTPPHMLMVSYLAEKMGVRALVVDYRLAPAHPFPIPLDDCVTAYRWLLGQGFSAQDIVMAGDSAGGNMTITALMKLRDCGDPLPAAAACLSPVADFSRPLGRFKDPLLHPRAMKLYNRSYVASDDPCNPLISPVYGDWHGLPPLLVHAGEDEILREDAVQVEKLAKASGVDVRLEIYPRMWHVWQINLGLPQAVQSLDDIAGFLKIHLGA